MPGTVQKTIDFGNSNTFTVLVNDILNEPSDCIVNAANGMLAHGRGVAFAIAEAAGDELYDECAAIVAKIGSIPVGEAVVTTAGNLPYKGVIHTVGPSMGYGQDGEMIKKALLSAFYRAHDLRGTSLSFPAISAGIFSVPKDVCAKAYIEAVTEFFNTNPETPLKTIRLCLFMGPVLDEVLRVI
jgi:O-acetyl-ADP-ribose deacetylase (regulator of RNase III)